MRGLNVEVLPGEVVHVTGPNGSGKTTLLRVLTGLLLPEEGSVAWNGQQISETSDDYGASLSWLGHNNGLKGDLTAFENLWFSIGLRRSCPVGDMEAALERVGITACRNLPARVLSAGQRRRLALARVLLAQTPLWILDEPFTNLDSDGNALVCALIAAHAQSGGMVLLAAHQSLVLPGYSARKVELQ